MGSVMVGFTDTEQMQEYSPCIGLAEFELVLSGHLSHFRFFLCSYVLMFFAFDLLVRNMYSWVVKFLFNFYPKS